MDFKRKAQISSQMIVYLAIALIVLVLIVVFATGGFSNLFSGITSTGQDDIGLAKSQCVIACNKAKTEVSIGGTDAWSTSSYCTWSDDIDVSGDGKVEGESEIGLKCYNDPISTNCSVVVDGVTCDQGNCESGCTSPAEQGGASQEERTEESNGGSS